MRLTSHTHAGRLNARVVAASCRLWQAHTFTLLQRAARLWKQRRRRRCVRAALSHKVFGPALTAVKVFTFLLPSSQILAAACCAFSLSRTDLEAFLFEASVAA